MSLTPEVQVYLRELGVTVSLVQHRLNRATRTFGPLSLTKAKSTFEQIHYHQRLGHISSTRDALEAVPEVLYTETSNLRALVTTYHHIGFKPDQLTAIFKNLRRNRDAAASFLEVPSNEIPVRYATLAALLALDYDGVSSSKRLATILSHSPGLLVADPVQLVSTVSWLRGLSWRALRLQRTAHSWPDILLRPASELEYTASRLQSHLNLSIEELVYLLTAAPQLLALSREELDRIIENKPASYELALEYRPRNGACVSKLSDDGGTMQLNTLYLMSLGVSSSEVARLAVDRPTLLRSRLWP